ncbi:MAG: peptidylprolyl isomerase [Oscillospiraceae bacterium]|nr:peptidylprolyl isomerase [Oscillospiraceae bacterium]
MYKNKKIKKFLLRLLNVLILCSVIFSCVNIMSSCGTKEGNPAMTLAYGKNTTVFSSNIYSYYLSYTKTMMLANIYMSIGYGAEDIPGMGDWPDYWANEYMEGVTYGDIAKMQAEDTAKQLLAIAAYCKEHDLALSKEQISDIDNAIKDVIKSDKYKNSKSAFNSVLIRFNIDDGIYKEIKKYESLSGVFGKDLFDQANGKRKITEDMIDSVYQQMCARVKHILILYSPGTRDAENNPEEYSEEELAERKARVEDLYDRIIAGENFDDLLSESEDPGSLAYPDGYTISEETSFVPEFIDAAFDMKIGDVRKVESSYGMHIMKKYALLPSDQVVDFIDAGDTWRNVVNKQLQTYIMNEELKPYIEKIEMHKDETDLFDIATSSVMFDCLELW